MLPRENLPRQSNRGKFSNRGNYKGSRESKYQNDNDGSTKDLGVKVQSSENKLDANTKPFYPQTPFEPCVQPNFTNPPQYYHYSQSFTSQRNTNPNKKYDERGRTNTYGESYPSKSGNVFHLNKRGNYKKGYGKSLHEIKSDKNTYPDKESAMPKSWEKTDIVKDWEKTDLVDDVEKISLNSDTDVTNTEEVSDISLVDDSTYVRPVEISTEDSDWGNESINASPQISTPKDSTYERPVEISTEDSDWGNESINASPQISTPKDSTYERPVEISTEDSDWGNECINASPQSSTPKKYQNKKKSAIYKGPNTEDIDSEDVLKDISFDIYDNKYRRKWNTNFKRVSEEAGDLFSVNKEYALAHCVAEDLEMGSGIAVQFRRDFKRQPELLQQRETQGGAAFLEIDGRYIFYLITKRESTKKPTLDTMFKAVSSMKTKMILYDVKKLAIPRIGCGLDRLEWSEVKNMLEYIFSDTDIEILVMNHQQEFKHKEDKKHRQCKVVNDALTSIIEIEKYTIILYLGTEDGYVSPEMEILDTKYKVLAGYRQGPRNVGKYILTNVLNDSYLVYGCIVKKTRHDRFDFLHFASCIKDINRINSKAIAKNVGYYYVAIQNVIDKHDDCLIAKICNVLRDGFYGVDIHVYHKT